VANRNAVAIALGVAITGTLHFFSQALYWWLGPSPLLSAAIGTAFLYLGIILGLVLVMLLMRRWRG
jgi:hypothetical protein